MKNIKVKNPKCVCHNCEHHLTIKSLKSQINRVKASINQTKDLDHFTQEDKDLLIPHYENQLKQLEVELNKFELCHT